MGVVYRAHDDKLDRDVALKVLPAGTLADDEARQRFHREARVLSRLNHPNIATVYDFDTQEGLDFLVMEYVPGTTLDQMLGSGPLGEKEIARLGVQLAQGLVAAHDEGIVHRDLKPANLRITPDQRLKILDFGLAKLLESTRQETLTAGGETATTVTLTDSGSTAAGTIPYMPPEQLRGEKVDARSDLYAAGVVLFEMATGQRPFRDLQVSRLITSILSQAPPVPRSLRHDLSPEFENIVLKSLEKEPERRYQSARDLRVDLERVAAPTQLLPSRQSGPNLQRRFLAIGGLAVALLLAVVAVKIFGGHRPPPRIRALAVLPLANLSGDPGQEYFVDGMTDELISEIGKIGALRVISRTSAMLYKNAKKSLPQIAKELHVDAVVQGSVRRSQGHVRVSAQLIDATSERHLWSQGYEREERNVLALESEVAQAIAHEIQVQLTPEEKARFATPRPVDPRAHELNLEGRSYADRISPENFKKAVTSFNEALTIDPGYAPAYAGLAQAYYGASSIYLPADEAMPKVRGAALRALELDPDLVEAQVSLGVVKAFYEWRWAEAEPQFKRAVQNAPSDAIAHQSYGYYLTFNKRFDEAIAEMRKARELDPLSALSANYSIYPLYEGRRYDAAIEAALELIDTLDPASWEYGNVHNVLGQAYLQKGRYPEAIAALRIASVHEKGTDNIYPLATLGSAYATAGKRKEALDVLKQLEARPKAMQDHAYAVAILYVALDDKEAAFTWLARSIDSRSEEPIMLNVDPQMDSLRSDPRFAVLLRRLGFSFD
jgi:serine/threonine protein kinase/Flp pilus assembly protein TadD